MNMNEIPMELITDRSFAKYRTEVTYQSIPRQKRTVIIMVENIGNGVINETLPFYSHLSLIKILFK